MPEELRPCPFCGSGRIFVREDNSGCTPVWWAECESCLARGPGCYNSKRAVVAWNRQPGATVTEAAALRQAQADARLMFATLYEVGNDIGLALIEDMFDSGVTEAECVACGEVGEKYVAADAAALVEPMRRILASVPR